MTAASHATSIDPQPRGAVVACHDCGLLQREAQLPGDCIELCRRCGAELYRLHPDSLERALAYTLGALVLFIVANAFPIVGLKIGADVVQSTLFGAVQSMYSHQMRIVAGVVFFTIFLMPLVQLMAFTYLLLPLKFHYVPPKAPLVFRALNLAHTWSMAEVFILGVMVALVKLAHIASVVPGIALWSYGAFILLFVAAASSFDPRALWEKLGARTTQVIRADAAHKDLLVCHDCGMISRPAAAGHEQYCSRCGAAIHFRKPNSISRTWAYLIAAGILYIPANVLPVMQTGSLFGSQQDTIMSGVVYLWISGSWSLAIIVFVASIVVPLSKIMALVFLLLSVQRHSRWQPKQRTKLYRVVEFVGRWSMLDIYVITLLVALVQLKALATIKPGPAAVAFGAVVVLTMLAANSFDPRLIWDPLEEKHG